MRKKEHIVRYTDEELRAKLERGEDRSDWERAASLTEEEINAAIAEDADEAGLNVDWSSATVRFPLPPGAGVHPSEKHGPEA